MYLIIAKLQTKKLCNLFSERSEGYVDFEYEAAGLFRLQANSNKYIYQ